MNPADEELDADQLLAERQRLEALFSAKFSRVISVMFTDLKDSTAITEREGDLAARDMMKRHNDIFFPIVERHRGVLVKTMGDGTLSYFDSAQSAARAAVEFQSTLRDYNAKHRSRVPIEVTIGIHTGEGIVEKTDIFGDVVNVAARFQAQAGAGEILVSESTFNALDDRTEIYCRHVRVAQLKGKSEASKIFKVFWDPPEIAKDKSLVAAGMTSVKPGAAPAQNSLKGFRILVFFAALVGVVLIIKVAAELFNSASSVADSRSVAHKAPVAAVAPPRLPGQPPQ